MPGTVVAALFFWTINGGLVGMLVLGLIPNGFYQLASINHGTWYAAVLR